MPSLRALVRPLLTAVQRRRREREMAAELQLHLDLLTESHRKAGLSPEEARAAALREFGHVEGIKERARDGWSWGGLDDARRDFRTSVRSLRRTPGFVVAVVLTLALGIGANTALFSILHAVLFRPLAVADEARLVVLREFQRQDAQAGYGVSYLNYRDWSTQARSYTGLALVSVTTVSVAGQGDATQAPAAVVSPSLFDVLGVTPALGRAFRPEDDRVGGAEGRRAVLLSYSTWQSRFGGSSAVLGQTLLIDELPHEIVGVTPAGLFPVEAEPVHYWVTTASYGDPGVSGTANASRGYRCYLAALGRLKDGVSLETARAELGTLHAGLVAAHSSLGKDLATEVTPLRELLVADLRPRLWLVFGMVATVLIIACVNVANLLLARATTRQRELAVRAALGAGAWALVRQSLVESLVLAGAGSALGLLLAAWFLSALQALQPASIPVLTALGLNAPVLLFAVVTAGLTGLLCGVAPAFVAHRSAPSDVLKSGGRSGTASGWPDRVRAALVAGQVALALVLLLSAGLLARSLNALQRVRPGFDTGEILTAQLSFSGHRYATDSFDPSKINGFLSRAEERLRALPGVTAVSHAQCVPLTPEENNTRFSVVENPSPPGQSVSAQLRFVGAGYFDLLRIPLRKGRLLAETDLPSSPAVALVNEAFVRSFLADRSPIGLHLKLGWGGSGAKEIVGVVADVRHRSLSDAPRPEVYVPQSQFANAGVTLLLRVQGSAAGLAPALRGVLSEIDPELPVTAIKTLDAYRETTLAPHRFSAFLFGCFAALALLLTVIGLFGVITYHVSRRTQEIGIRVALGATPRDVLTLITGQGMRLVGLGIGLGLVVSLGATRLLRSHLYGVSPTDPLTFAAIALLLASVAYVACLLPTRKALRVDPNVTLRCD